LSLPLVRLTAERSISASRSWDEVHSAAWSFSQAQEHRLDPKKEQRVIALIKPRKEDPNLRRQIALLNERPDVVDVTEEDRASTKLGELLHLVS